MAEMLVSLCVELRTFSVGLLPIELIMKLVQNFIRHYVDFVRDMPTMLAGIVTIWLMMAVLMFVIITVRYPVVLVIVLFVYGLGWCVKRVAGDRRS